MSKLKTISLIVVMGIIGFSVAGCSDSFGGDTNFDSVDVESGYKYQGTSGTSTICGPNSTTTLEGGIVTDCQ